MARTFALSTLRTAVRRRADVENSTFLTDAEINTYISASYCELYDLLIKSGLNYQRSTQTPTIVAGTQSYALPADYYGTIGVDYQLDSTQWVTLPEIMVHERNYLPVSGGSRSLAYEIAGSNLILYPAPASASQVYRHLYIPAPADLTSDGTTIDGVSGWEELVIVDAAIKCLSKEESDTNHLERERARLTGRIEEAALNRAWSTARRVSRVEDIQDEIVADPASWRYR